MSDAVRLRLRILPFLLLVAAMAAWTLWQGLPVLRADLTTMEARRNVDQWARAGKGWSTEDWVSTRGALKAALKLTPADPVLHTSLAQLYVTQGIVAWADPVQRSAFFEEAVDHQRAALAARPGDGATWAQLATSLFALDRPRAEFEQAWRQAQRNAPREAAVQRALFDLGLARWDDLPADIKAWVRATWTAAAPEQKAVFRADAKRRGKEDLLPSM
jgi:tetratricopeptide (TPR) repeat protein